MTKRSPFAGSGTRRFAGSAFERVARRLVAAICTVIGATVLTADDGRDRAQDKPAGLAAAAPADGPPGDASRGKALVDSGGCFDCHRIGDRGSRLGPDLSEIGARRTPDQLLRAMVAPDEEVVPENRFVRVATRDGATITGRLLNQDALSVQMLNPKEELKTYLRANLREFTIVDKGLMPSVQGKLTDQQIADIVAYLSSLK
jgi:putative heme-binding domain-containing protein